MDRSNVWYKLKLDRQPGGPAVELFDGRKAGSDWIGSDPRAFHLMARVRAGPRSLLVFIRWPRIAAECIEAFWEVFRLWPG